MSLSILVVDDEALAREGLKIHLSRAAAIDACVCVSDGYQALDVLKKDRFDVIFLDIELPGITGFGLLDQLRADDYLIPAVVFTTGHQEFALRAFDYPVADYLLKPYSTMRVEQTIKKLTTRSIQPQSTNTPSGTSNTTTNHSNSLSFKNGCNWLQVKVDDLLWIEAEGDYMLLHTNHGKHILRSTMSALERQLIGHSFVRINRSCLVNMGVVVSHNASQNGTYVMTLKNNKELRVSRKYKLLIDAQREHINV